MSKYSIRINTTVKKVNQARFMTFDSSMNLKKYFL